jgi:hypothetical protein
MTGERGEHWLCFFSRDPIDLRVESSYFHQERVGRIGPAASTNQLSDISTSSKIQFHG